MLIRKYLQCLIGKDQCPGRVYRMFDWQGSMFIGSISNVGLGQIVDTISISDDILSICMHF